MAELPTKTGNKLEIELYRYGTLVFGKVTKMDESLRDNGTLYESKDGDFSIVSDNFPDLDDCTINVRGSDKSLDKAILNYNFDSVKEAVRFCAMAARGINTINGKLAKEEDVDEDIASLEKMI